MTCAGSADPTIVRGAPLPPAAAMVLERVSDAFVALDRTWHYTYVNPQAARIFGRTPEQMVGKHIWTEFPEGVGQSFYHAYHRAMVLQESIFFEDYYPPYDRWFENRIYPSADGLSIFFHDITDRKRAEALLVGQSRVLEMVARGASLADSLDALVRFVESFRPAMKCSVLLLDVDGVHVRHASAPSLPRSYTDAIDGSPIGPRAGSCGTAAYLRRPVIVEDIAVDPLWDDYRELALRHGLRACWSTPIFDEQGSVLGTFAMYRGEPQRPSESDIQAVEVATRVAAVAITHQRSHDALLKSEGRFRRLVDSNLIGVIIADVSGLISEANDEFLRIVGYDRAALDAGKLRWDALTPPEYHSVDVQILAQLDESGVSQPYEKEYVHASGRRVPVQLTVAMLEGTGGECIALVEDLTERRERELIRQRYHALEEENRLALEGTRLKSEFLANMSHELRTPLNAILGFSELLVDEVPGPVNARQREYLEDVIRSGQHLLQLINDVLDLGKIEAGKLELSPEALSLREVLAEVCSVLRPLAQQKQIGLTMESAPDVDAVYLDRQRLKQVLFNLTANAVKFTCAGGSVHVSARRHGAQQLELCVRDTGVGIRAADIPKLFQAFQQLEPQHAQPREGTGLGLALTKRIVESQGGSVHVESEPGRGSTFSVLLPLEPAPAARG